MNYNELARFLYKGKTYIYYVLPDRPKNVLYGYLENNELKIVVDSSDIAIMQEAYQKIFISNDQNNHVKVSTTKHNNRLFQIMYDKVSGLRFFYEIYKDKYYLPLASDGKELFAMHNNFELYDAGNFSDNLSKLNKDLKAKQKAETKFLKIVLSIGTVLVLASTSFSVYVGYIAPNYPYSQTVQYINDLKESPKGIFSEEKLREAINNNANLIAGEKEYFLDEIPYLVKNQKYVDFDTLIKKFSTVEIEYVNGYRSDKPWVRSEYDSYRNKIFVYGCYSFETADKGALRNDICHVSSKATDAFGRGVYEATLSARAFEYKEKDTFSYDANVYYQMILYKIIGEEPFIAYTETGDIKFLIDALVKVVPDENDAIGLISALTEIVTYKEKIASYDTVYNNYSDVNEARKEAEENLKNANIRVLALLENYFKAVKGYSIYEDAFSLLCFKKATGLNINVELLFNDGKTYPLLNYDLKEAHFLDKYKREYSSLYLVCKDLDNFKIELNGMNTRLIKTGSGYTINTGVDTPQLYLKHTNNQEFGNGLAKALKSLINYEQNYDSENNYLPYKEQVTYLKILCEIIGTEPFERYRLTGDLNEIIFALRTYERDEGDIIKLLESIDLTAKYYEQLNNTGGANNSEPMIVPGDVSEELATARNIIYSDFSFYFRMATNHDMSEDIIINLYYQGLIHYFTFKDYKEFWDVCYINKNGKTTILNEKADYKIIKGYFYKDINNYPGIAIECKNGTVILISDSDSRIMGKVTNEACDDYFSYMELEEEKALN